MEIIDRGLFLTNERQSFLKVFFTFNSEETFSNNILGTCICYMEIFNIISLSISNFTMVCMTENQIMLNLVYSRRRSN